VAATNEDECHGFKGIFPSGNLEWKKRTTTVGEFCQMALSQEGNWRSLLTAEFHHKG
jgi:hypothetical protein